MKEFMCKHPFISLLMLDTVICGILNGISIIKGKTDSSNDDDD